MIAWSTYRSVFILLLMRCEKDQTNKKKLPVAVQTPGEASDEKCRETLPPVRKPQGQALRAEVSMKPLEDHCAIHISTMFLPGLGVSHLSDLTTNALSRRYTTVTERTEIGFI